MHFTPITSHRAVLSVETGAIGIDYVNETPSKQLHEERKKQGVNPNMNSANKAYGEFCLYFILLWS